jgi:hypothetical protein
MRAINDGRKGNNQDNFKLIEILTLRLDHPENGEGKIEIALRINSK